MNLHSKTLTVVCLAGLLISLLLAGGVLIARGRVLAQTTTTFYTPLSDEAEWEGDWEFSELGADPSQASTERVTIPFVGTDFALQVRRGDYRGYFFIVVDGRPANRLPRGERGAYLVLTSPDYTTQVVTIPVATGLDDGPHEAVVVAERGWDQWPLVGWSVSRGPDIGPYHWTLVGLGILGLLCLGGAVWWGNIPAFFVKVVSGWGDKLISAGRGHHWPETRHPALARVVERLHLDDGTVLVVTLAVVGIFYFSPWLVLTCVSGLALIALILLRLDVGLALVAAVTPFYLYPRPLFGKAFSMAEILVLLCGFSWGVRQISRWCVGRREERAFGIRHPRSSLDIAVLFFALVAVASLVVAEHRRVALRELRVIVLEPAFFYLMLRTGHWGGGFIHKHGHEHTGIWRIVDFFVGGAVIVALIGLLQYGLGVNVITAEQGLHRLRSVYGSPNNVGLYLGRVLPILVSVALFGVTRRRRVAYGLAIIPVGLAILLSFSKGALILGVPLSLLSLIVLASGPLRASVSALPQVSSPRLDKLAGSEAGGPVQSRPATGSGCEGESAAVSSGAGGGSRPVSGGLDGEAVASGRADTWSGGRRRAFARAFVRLAECRRSWVWALLGMVTMAGIAVAAVILLSTPRFASLFDTKSGTTFFRLRLWRSSWMMFCDHPWLGVGLDNFLYQYRGRYVLPAAWQEPDLSHPHNILLDYGCRLGLCGLIAGLWLQMAFWRLALPLRWPTGNSPTQPERTTDSQTGGFPKIAGSRRTTALPLPAGTPGSSALALGLMGSMVNFLAHGLVDASYFVIDLAFAFFLALGLVQRLARSETDGLEFRLEI